jgi:hypothetical protein
MHCGECGLQLFIVAEDLELIQREAPHSRTVEAENTNMAKVLLRARLSLRAVASPTYPAMRKYDLLPACALPCTGVNSEPISAVWRELH